MKTRRRPRRHRPRLLALLQADCSLTNDELARRSHVSPAPACARAPAGQAA